MRSFITKFRRAHRESLDPNMLWRMLLWACVIGISSVAIFAYITHDWALSVEAPSTPIHNSRGAFSLAELEEVISYYHQKEVNFEVLLRTSPEAPIYERAKGVVATTTLGLQLDESVDIVQKPTRTQ